VAALIALPLVAFLSSLVIGRYPIPPSTIALTLLSKILPIEPTWEPVVEVIVFDVRLPRAILALAVGASLAISGTAFQAMFQNPLVSSDILGVSAGAGFGAALAIAVSTGPLAIQASAFLFGLVAVGLAYAISRQFRTTVMLLLVLAGIVVGSVFSALISLVTYTVDPQRKLPAIVFWLLGSLSTSSTRDLVDALPLMAFGIGGLLLLRWRLNVLSLGDEEARSLGVNVELLRIVVIGCATVVTAAAVSISGIIGWVGLVIPHVARMLVGPDHRVLLPASVAIGGTYSVAHRQPGQERDHRRAPAEHPDRHHRRALLRLPAAAHARDLGLNAADRRAHRGHLPPRVPADLRTAGPPAR
jgi:iron complex transport system permease protein